MDCCTVWPQQLHFPCCLLWLAPSVQLRPVCSTSTVTDVQLCCLDCWKLENRFLVYWVSVSDWRTAKFLHVMRRLSVVYTNHGHRYLLIEDHLWPLWQSEVSLILRLCRDQRPCRLRVYGCTQWTSRRLIWSELFWSYQTCLMFTGCKLEQTGVVSGSCFHSSISTDGV